MCSTNEPLIDPARPPTAVNAPVIPSWTRIRITDKDDESKIYQLLDTAARHPDALSSVKEATVKLKQVEEGCHAPSYSAYSKPYHEIERSRPLAADHALRSLVQALHHPNEAIKDSYSDGEILRRLTWQDPSVLAARSAQLEADGSKQEQEMYLHYMNRSFTHFAAPLLLLNCPNIETLSCSACPIASTYPEGLEGVYNEHLLRQTLLRNNYGKLPHRHLQHLKYVDLHPEYGLSWEGGEYYSHIDLLGEIRLFHRLPMIESVSVQYIKRSGGADAVEFFPPKSCDIKRVHVRHSILDEYAPLIRMSRNLEEFTYTVGGRKSPRGSFYRVTGKTIGKALWDQRKSLRKLDLDVDSVLLDDKYDDNLAKQSLGAQGEDLGEPYWRDEWFRLDEQDSDGGPLHVWELPDTRVYNCSIGHLRDFEHLTHLSIGVKLLLGLSRNGTPFRLVDALPPSLESLHIRGYRKGEVAKYDEAIDELLEGRGVKLPALREISGVLELSPSTDWDGEVSEDDDGDLDDDVISEDSDVGWVKA